VKFYGEKMNTKDAEYFVRLAHIGSFTKAAKQLKIPKSTLSRRISHLEQALGVKLIERTTREIMLTDLGRGYVTHCEQIIENVEAANNYLSQVTSAPSGRIRVSVSIDTALIYMQDIFAEFILAYPDIELEVELTQRVVNLVEEGIDVAIRVRNLKDSTMIARKIGSFEMGLYASSSFYQNQNIPKHPNELIDTDCIGMGVGTPHWNFSEQGKNIELLPKHRYRVNNAKMIQAAVVKGLGISILPKSTAQPLVKSGQLISLLDNFIGFQGEMYAVYPSRQYVPTRISTFIKFIIEQLAKE